MTARISVDSRKKRAVIDRAYSRKMMRRTIALAILDLMIYDISVPITNTMPVWPGDPPVHLQRQSHESRDHSHIVTVSEIRMGSHTGTHFDAPFHMIKGGKKLHEFSLDVLVGKTTVFETPGLRSIGRSELERFNWNGVERVLFKTDNSSHWQDGQFYEEFVYLQPEGAEFLVERGMRMVGIDYLSIDKFKSPSHPTHMVLLSKNILIIEGLNLKNVPQGEYMLCALPLNLQDADGSPGRVILTN